MLEAQGDIFSGGHDWLVFTANSIVTRDQRLVMGAGIAKQVRERYPGIDSFFGKALICNHLEGLRYHLLLDHEHKVAALQTKVDWREASSLDLVKASCYALGMFSYYRPMESFALSRPGCGLGGLTWERVKPAIATLLPDNVTVYGT